MNVAGCIKKKIKDGIKDFYFDALWNSFGTEEGFFLKSFKEYVIE